MANRQVVKGIGIGLALAVAAAVCWALLSSATRADRGVAARRAGIEWIVLDLTEETWKKIEQNPNYCPTAHTEIEITPNPGEVSYWGGSNKPRVARWISSAGSRYTWTVSKKADSRLHFSTVVANVRKPYSDTFTQKSKPTVAPPFPDGRSLTALWLGLKDWPWHYDVVLKIDGCRDPVKVDPDIYIDK